MVTIGHITDIHLDLDYTVGAAAECGEPSCCWPSQVQPSGQNTSCGFWGDHHGDTPPAMLDFLIEQAGGMNLTAVYATGDDPSHQVWQQTGPINNNHSVYVAQRYNALLGNRGPGGRPVQIVPGLGNHAGFPVNCFAIPPSVNRSDLY